MLTTERQGAVSMAFCKCSFEVGGGARGLGNGPPTVDAVTARLESVQTERTEFTIQEQLDLKTSKLFSPGPQC